MGKRGDYSRQLTTGDGGQVSRGPRQDLGLRKSPQPPSHHHPKHTHGSASKMREQVKRAVRKQIMISISQLSGLGPR